MTGLAEAFGSLMGALDRLDVPFLVGGSVASSTHGLPRQTNDVDLLADVSLAVVDELVETLEGSFYVDRGSIVAALEQQRGFNVIHLASAWKFDIFVAGNNPFSRSELARRRMATSGIPGLERVEFPVSSPEDTILAKLVCFRKGGEISDRQWHDMLGILRVQAGRLDLEYMTNWAPRLGVADLLARLLS